MGKNAIIFGMNMINFTLAAALKVKSLIDEEGNPRLNLRVYITGGGCSGFQYGFTFDENINADDIVIEKKLDEDEDEDEDEGGDGGESGSGTHSGSGSVKSNVNAEEEEEEEEEEEDGGEGGSGTNGGSVKLLIDPMSFQYLQGAKIDYRQDVNGEQFVIQNPNAKTTCGCGSSFSA